MRLCLIGPVDGRAPVLARAVAVALDQLRADAIVYLGVDDALDIVGAAWMSLLGVEAPLAERVAAVVDADAEAIHQTLQAEHLARRLSRVRALASATSRSVELVHDRIVLLVADKADLDEEDLLPASLIIFGRGSPTLRRVGTRVFLSPGTPGKAGEGILLLDEGEGDGTVTVTFCDVAGVVRQREVLEATRGARVRVQGAV